MEGAALALRSVKWWTEEVVMEMMGVVWWVWAVRRRVGRRRWARRKVETTFIVIDDLVCWVLIAD